MFNLKSVKNATRFVVGAVATASDYVTNNSITEDVLVASINGVKKAVKSVRSIDIAAAKAKVGSYLDDSQCYFEQTVADVKTKRAAEPIVTKPVSVLDGMSKAQLKQLLEYAATQQLVVDADDDLVLEAELDDAKEAEYVAKKAATE